MAQHTSNEAILKQLFDAAICAVDGFNATANAVSNILANNSGKLTAAHPVHVIAIGKAADAMARGAVSILKNNVVSGLVITKHQHLSEELIADTRFTTIESGHPVPDIHSLRAGAMLVETLQLIPVNHQLLFLVSGGASALVEHLIEPMQLNDLIKLNEQLLSAGHTIGEMNRQRRSISQIKGGKLVKFVPNLPVTQLLISDVPGDVLGDIGSGLLAPQNDEPASSWKNIDTQIIASSAIAQQAASAEAEKIGLIIQQDSGCLDGELNTISERVASTLMSTNAVPGVYIWGGETTVVLPKNPGRGGRNQQLALSIATRIDGDASISALCAGTDGTDGPTNDAGGLVNGNTIKMGRELSLDSAFALTTADAGHYLEKTNALFTTGPTGTNVMDLVIAIKS